MAGQQQYRDGDVVLIRGTVRTVRGEPRVSFKKGEARTKLKDVEIASVEAQTLKPGDVIEWTDPDRSGEPAQRGTVRRGEGNDYWVRFDNGGERIVAAKHSKRVEDDAD